MGKCLPSKMPFGRPDQIFSRLRLGPRDEREAVRMCLKTLPDEISLGRD